MQKFNKRFLSFALITTLGFNTTANAVYAVIDSSHIAQSVKDYSQHIKDYTQMLKDTLNFEKQMKELGVDMDSITEIYGTTMEIIDTATGLYEDIINIPEDIYGELAKIKNTCNLLSQSSYAKNFKEALGEAKKIKGRYDGCLNAMNNTDALLKDIEAINEEIQDLNKQMINNGDPDGSLAKQNKQLALEKENIKETQKFLNFTKQNQDYQKMTAKLELILEQDSKAYSDKIKKFSEQMKKPNNAKQAQALTNALLLEVIQQQQKVFELQTQYYEIELAEKQRNLEQKIEPKKKQQNLKSYKELNPHYAEIEEKAKSIRYNKAGLPIFIPQINQ